MRSHAGIRVRELWRYPVKSMGGQRVASATIGPRGLHADRLWAVRDLELGGTTTARRLPILMQCAARFAEEPSVDAGPGRAVEAIITFPNGQELSTKDPAVHKTLTDLVGRNVELRPLPALSDKASYRGPVPTQADLRRQFEIPDDEPLPDTSMFPLRKLAELARYATPVGTFADAYPLHLITTGSLEAMRRIAPQADFDVRRFRPNVVLEGNGELDWCGGTLTADEAVISPVIPTLRCSMPVREQPGLDAQPDVMRAIKSHSDRCLGVYANVERAGELAEGDVLDYAPGEAAGAAARLGDRLKRSLVRAGSRAVPRGS
ncbi:MOSC domain-containing protein [soil metagenome]